jgi:hypothetical protein
MARIIVIAVVAFLVSHRRDLSSLPPWHHDARSHRRTLNLGHRDRPVTLDTEDVR